MFQALEERCSTVEELFLFSDEKLAGIFYVHDDNEDTKKKLDGQYKRVRMARNIMQNYVCKSLSIILTIIKFLVNSCVISISLFYWAAMKILRLFFLIVLIFSIQQIYYREIKYPFQCLLLFQE